MTRDFPGASHFNWVTRSDFDDAPDWYDDTILDDESQDELCTLWETVPGADVQEPATILVPCPACFESCGYEAYSPPLLRRPLLRPRHHDAVQVLPRSWFGRGGRPRPA